MLGRLISSALAFLVVKFGLPVTEADLVFLAGILVYSLHQVFDDVIKPVFMRYYNKLKEMANG